MLSLFELTAALLTVTAAFAWVNHRLIGLPANIGLLVMGLAASLLLIGIEFLFPDVPVHGPLLRALQQIDFYDAVINGMLAFLLFAGALHVEFGRLRNRAVVISILAVIGVLLSIAIVACGTWLAAQVLGVPLPFAWAVVFGTLIAPTDPVAVISTLRSVSVPEQLETDMTGEALFNDGIAVVAFTIALQAALGRGDDFGVATVLRLVAFEALGGAVLGLAAGYLAYRAIRAIDDYAIEVMISLALVTATYALASKLHMSGPIAVVVAGVLIGNRSTADAMSEITRRYVFGFWTLIDEILNAVLFLLIGLEVLVVRLDPSLGWIGVAAVPIATLARLIAVAGPVLALDRWQHFVRGTIPVLTWGGVRGGISVALALSLPDSPARPVILEMTYAVVLFTVIVQGLSLGWLTRRSVACVPSTKP